MTVIGDVFRERPAAGDVRRPKNVALEQRMFRPIVGFAALGAAWVALMIWVLGHWIAEGKTARNTVGTDQVPHYMKAFLNSLQVVVVLGTIWVVRRFLIKPWRQDRRLGFDSILVIAMFVAAFQDPLSNYLRTAWFTYNTYLWNFGSWSTNMPGWLSPNGHRLPEAVLTWTVPSYVFIIFGGTLVASALMRRAKRRWPQMGTAGLIGMLFVGMMVFDLLLEPPFMLGGTWSYPGAIKGLTLFHGRYYQFPIYESIFWGSTWTAFTCLHYFRNDKGQTIVERGVDRLRIGEKAKTALRILAVIGFTQTAYFLLYNVPAALASMHSSPFPEEILKRPYLTDGLCGPGTSYSCGGPAVPIPHGDSGRIDPEGRFVAPPAD